MTTSGWISAVNWKNVFEIAAGVAAAAIFVLGIAYGAGVASTNMSRDVLQHTAEINQNRIDIDENTRAIKANREEMQSQRAVLSRIEEGVEWIKKDLEKDGK